MQSEGGSEDAQEAFEAGYGECRRLYGNGEWVDAAWASNEFVALWIDKADLPARSRQLLADAMWIACNSAAAESWDQTGVRSEIAAAGMNDLIAWLRRQPEVEFRQTEARMLCERIHWYGGRDEALDSLEQVVEVLADLDDPTVAKDTVTRVVKQLAWLLEIANEDHQRYLDGMTEALDEAADSPPDPDELGVTDMSVTRMERVADALSDLGDCLDLEDDNDASELRAALLLAELEAVSKLGQGDRVEARFEAFAALGDAALAACDSQIRRIENALDDSNDYSAAVPAMLMTKATVLFLNDEDDSALVIVTEIIDRFGTRNEPAVAAVVEKARELQTDLLKESDDDSV